MTYFGLINLLIWSDTTSYFTKFSAIKEIGPQKPQIIYAFFKLNAIYSMTSFNFKTPAVFRNLENLLRKGLLEAENPICNYGG
ncbi:hypothetical protein RCL_jg22275.t1 [Rhizophagus clarus]|uniref:Uncharacterized protein n=1 Tax=Rhizophagus clarus TaxID=94130 RepID=A0A8H3L709_9GLOM|nr:hypothetical protein RCL_jg22275.t1 [Rhizophagus clarus]